MLPARCRTLLLVLTLSLWLLPSPARADEPEAMTIQVIAVNHQPPQALVETIRPFLSRGGTVVPDSGGGRLIVRDTPRVIRQIEELVRKLDVPAPQVRMRIQMAALDRLSRSGAGVTAVGVPRGAAVTVFGTSNSANTQAQSDMNLVVLSGGEGSILLVERSPHVAWFSSYAARLGYVVPGVYFTEVGTGVRIRPRVAGDTVVVSVVPFISYQSPTGEGSIAFREAANEVSIPNGSTMAVAVGSASSSELVRFIFGSVATQSTSDLTIYVTPEIMPDTP